jgi:phage repressor protein C with HTH and peptisase S24 domain
MLSAAKAVEQGEPSNIDAYFAQTNIPGFVEEEQAVYRLSDGFLKKASAGTGSMIIDGPPEKVAIPNIPKYSKVSYVIGVRGDSMEPIFSDDDALLVEGVPSIDVGELGIFAIDGECYVKKLGDGRLISLNATYEDIILTEHSPCVCMGRVVDAVKPEQLREWQRG